MRWRPTDSAAGAPAAQPAHLWSRRSGKVKTTIEVGRGDTIACAEMTSPALTIRASSHLAASSARRFIAGESPGVVARTTGACI